MNFRNLFKCLVTVKVTHGVPGEFSCFDVRNERFILALRFQGNPHVMRIFHPSKPGWTVYIENFSAWLAEISVAQTGISASGPARLLI